VQGVPVAPGKPVEVKGNQVKKEGYENQGGRFIVNGPEKESGIGGRLNC